MSEELKLLPCPADYPPCPLCGKHPEMLESGHIVCCNLVVDDVDAWFLLPRALTWTTEPPTVQGYYWCRYKGSGKTTWSPAYIPAVGDLQSYCMDKNELIEWAGPIDLPQEPPHE